MKEVFMSCIFCFWSWNHFDKVFCLKARSQSSQYHFLLLFWQDGDICQPGWKMYQYDRELIVALNIDLVPPSIYQPLLSSADPVHDFITS